MALQQAVPQQQQLGTENLQELKNRVRKASSRQTSEDPKKWSPLNPACGQCAATALVVNDIFGGQIIKVKVRNYHNETHYYNVLPTGEAIDLTKEQYDEEPPEFENTEWISLEKLRKSSTRSYFEISLKMAQSGF
jgi:hypothetical protein